MKLLPMMTVVVQRTAPEVYERGQDCEDLIRKLVERSLLSKAGKRYHLTELEILERYEGRLKTRWTLDAEARSVMQIGATPLKRPCLMGALQ